MKKTILLFVFVFILAAISCGKGGNPLQPAPDLTNGQAVEVRTSAHSLWGLWDVAIDSKTQTVDIAPIRDAAFHLNVVKYMQPPLPVGLGIDLGDLDLEHGIFEMVVSLTHPFDDPSLTGFDVKGIFLGKGSETSDWDHSIRYSGLDEARLLNPDGWTRWWNMKEFTEPGMFGYTQGILGTKGFITNNTMNPFKFFSDDLEAEDEFFVDPIGRNSFTPDKKTNSRFYRIQFQLVGGSPVIQFQYAVDACWASPTGDPTDLSNFPPQANQAEAYQISVADNGSNAFYDVPSDETGGNLKFSIGLNYHNSWSNPSAVMDEIGVVIESPTLFDPPIELNQSNISQVTQYGIIFSLDIPDVTPDSPDHQEILIHASNLDLTYDQGFGTPAPGKFLESFSIWEPTIIDHKPVAGIPEIQNVDIDRSVSGKITGFSIDWNDVENASEYVVYRSTDPYETAGPMSFEVAPDGTTSESYYHYDIDSGSAEANGQWMFYVTARAFAGDPSTESDPSGEVLIDITGFENFAEGQNEWRRRYNSVRNRFLYYPSIFGVDGSGGLILSPNTNFYRYSCAYCVSPEIPEIDNVTECYFEFAHKRVVDCPEDYGYSICSTPSIQNPNVINDVLHDPEGTIPD
ncbi:MAG: hypothetical protein ABIC40_04215, partial [bacterium]